MNFWDLPSFNALKVGLYSEWFKGSADKRKRAISQTTKLKVLLRIKAKVKKFSKI